MIFYYLCIRICRDRGVAQSVQSASVTLKRSSVRARSSLPEEIYLDVAQLVAHLVRDQEVAGSSPVIQTKGMARVFPVIPFIK